MSANVHALPVAQKRTMREDRDGHTCPRCRAPIHGGPGGIVCPACNAVLICETAPVTVFRTRTLTPPEIGRLNVLDDNGGDPATLSPELLFTVLTGRELPGPTVVAPPAPPGLPGTQALILCLAFCVASGLVGLALGH